MSEITRDAYLEAAGKIGDLRAEIDRLERALREIAQPMPEKGGDWGFSYNCEKSSKARIGLPGTRTIPDFLVGENGEVVFVPRDLTADTVTRAYERALVEGYNLAGMQVDEVVMLPVPEYFTGLDVEWVTVREGTPGAVRFWRFRS